MRVLLLCRLRPGDIILETGDPRIAAAGGGLFGHAAVALGRLVKIEAGKESGVELNPFDFVAYRSGERRIVGIPIEPTENVCVLRRKHPLDEGTIRGEALWEAGRAYSVPKLLELPDLPQTQRRLLERKLGQMQAHGSEDVREARFCSEVAAKVLQLPKTIVSPNTLANAPELEPVIEAIVDLNGDWTEAGSDASLATIGAMLAQVRVGLAELGLSELRAAAGRILATEPSLTQAQEAGAIESRIGGAIDDAIRILNSVEELEPSVLASGSVRT
jgi:hypothetical protein